MAVFHLLFSNTPTAALLLHMHTGSHTFSPAKVFFIFLGLGVVILLRCAVCYVVWRTKMGATSVFMTDRLCVATTDSHTDSFSDFIRGGYILFCSVLGVPTAWGVGGTWPVCAPRPSSRGAVQKIFFLSSTVQAGSW